MRILLVHRWFWPDSPPYAEMLRVIAARLAADGHQVRVLTAQPAYTSTTAGRRMPRRERLDGFGIRRVRLLPEPKRNFLLRGLNTLLFAFAILRQALARGGWDVVMTSTMPPVLIGLGGRWCARLRGAAFVYHMMDIHPEAAAEAGMMRRGLPYRLLRAVDSRNCARAARVVVLSGDMQATLRARGLDDARVRVIDNFELRGDAVPASDGGEAAGSTAEAPAGDADVEQASPFTVLFAGNIGRFQALDGLLDAAGRMADRVGELRFLFLGEGVGLEDLQRRAATLPPGLVEFRGRVPVSAARAEMQAADLGVVALAPGIHKVAFPSKTMTYACAGLPMLALVESGSSLAALIHDAGLGDVAEPRDADAIVAALERALARTPEERAALRARVRAHGREHYSRATAERRWSELYADLAAARGGTAARAGT